MPRTSSTIRQADIARVIRAAKQAGAQTVEIKAGSDVTFVVHLHAATLKAEVNEWATVTEDPERRGRNDVTEDEMRDWANHPYLDGGYAYTKEEYAKFLSTKPWSKRERAALLAFFERPEGSRIGINERGATFTTLQRFVERGYVIPCEAREDGKVPDHEITRSGREALIRLKSGAVI